MSSVLLSRGIFSVQNLLRACHRFRIRSQLSSTQMSRIVCMPFVQSSSACHGNLFSPERSSNSYSRSFNSKLETDSQGPTTINYSSLLQEDEFHALADSTIYNLQEKFEEYGDRVQIDGFDIDYGNEVLTLKIGDLGTYVLNKQTPNRQIWLSSPMSGPSRFDWDQNDHAWIYRRTGSNLLKLLEEELTQLCGDPFQLT